MSPPAPPSNLPTPARLFQCGRFALDLSASAVPCVMGILNLAPDSFSDGGEYADVRAAIARAEHMVIEGASIIDVGAESSRPGSTPLSDEQEWARLAPVLGELTKLNVPISVDTYHPTTMHRAIEVGCDMVNCIAGFREAGAIEAVVNAKVGLCVMHMQGQPQDMQLKPQYQNVCAEVSKFLLSRVETLIRAGINGTRILLDPGYGFGKSADHNLSLLQEQDKLLATGYPILAGLSRKGTLGLIVGRPVQERLAASVAAALFAAHKGARVLRVHDVKETVDALKVWRACELGKLAS